MNESEEGEKVEGQDEGDDDETQNVAKVVAEEGATGLGAIGPEDNLRVVEKLAAGCKK